MPQAACPGSGMACFGSRSRWYPLCLCARGIALGTPPRGHRLAEAGQRTGKLIAQLLSLLLRAAALQSAGRFSAGKKTQNFLCFSVL